MLQYPHDFLKRDILSEHVENKAGYVGLESDPLITKSEFPYFFLQMCDSYELDKFDETLTLLRRSIILVSNTIEADKAFKRISPLLKPLPTSMIKRSLDEHFVAPGPESNTYFQYAPAIASIKQELGGVPDALGRESFKDFIVRKLGQERTLPHIFSHIINDMAEGFTKERETNLVNKLFDLWDADNSGKLEANEIDDVLRRLDYVYDMLYDSETYASPGKQNKEETTPSEKERGEKIPTDASDHGEDKTKMRRASMLVLKQIGVEGDNISITKEQFPLYIKELCRGFGEGGLTNLLYFMTRVVIEVKRLKKILGVVLTPGFKEAYEKNGFLRFLEGVADSVKTSCGIDIDKASLKQLFDGTEKYTSSSEISNLTIETLTVLSAEDFEKVVDTMGAHAREWARGNTSLPIGTPSSNPVSSAQVGNTNNEGETMEPGAIQQPKGGGCCILQ